MTIMMVGLIAKKRIVCIGLTNWISQILSTKKREDYFFSLATNNNLKMNGDKDGVITVLASNVCDFGK